MNAATKIALKFFLYKAKLDQGFSNRLVNGNPQFRFTFKLYPRTFNIIIAVIIFSPIIILLEGIFGVVEVFKDTNRVESWSSYEIFTDGRTPTKLEMYAKS